MIIRMIRGAFVLVTSAMVIPYTVAIICNILHGWPQCRNKYRRALSPKKVFGLNYVLLQMLRDKSKYILLYFRWKNFYKNADPRRLFKNLTYGRNDCTLDVYLPFERDPDANLPVVIFVYGGSWSSGDKSSYGLLCSNIVSDTQTVVVCPNYSVYPKGYVDDMIQDTVDSIAWVIENIHDYGGDKNKLILLGHSAGAHLATMAILELLHDERLSVKPSFKFQPVWGQMEQSAFTEMELSAARAHRLEDSSGSSESFAIVSENGSTADQSVPVLMELTNPASNLLTTSRNSDAMQLSFGSDVMQSSLNSDGADESFLDLGGDSGKSHMNLEADERTSTAAGFGDVNKNAKDEQRTDGNVGDARSRSHSGSLGDDEEERDDDSGDNDSVVTVRPKDIEKHATLVDMCKCIKAFIGLAGVYSISEHFQHETYRGIEDVSYMCRAHYGEDHFARFSPKEIIRSLGRCLSLPVMVLVHGMNDYIAPMSSSLSFADALADISACVKVKVIPGCDHYEVCLSLMDKHHKYYCHIMNIIMETISSASAS
uniref:BD-FAE-like domain-containing protein n=1 Tax=Arion vulgaris TaxID=1028688 RepID=A0A0B7A7P4_9EUPU